MEKEKKRFNVEEHTTLDNKIIDVFPISHRYIHKLEAQLKKQQEIIDKIRKEVNKQYTIVGCEVVENWVLLQILEDKEETDINVGEV